MKYPKMDKQKMKIGYVWILPKKDCKNLPFIIQRSDTIIIHSWMFSFIHFFKSSINTYMDDS